MRDLRIWNVGKEARKATRFVYELSSKARFAKDFAFVNQIRRSAVSILSNIAEGFERNGDREFIQFLTIAKGSCGEARAQLYVASDQNYVDEKEFVTTKNKLIETSRLIAGLINYLKQSELKGSKYR